MVRNPDCGEVERGFPHLDSLQRFGGRPRAHGQEAAQHQAVRGHDIAAHLDDILVCLELEVVAHPDRRDHDAQLHGQLFAEVGDAGKQVSTLGFIHQADQPVADLQLERVHLQVIFNAFFLRRRGGRGKGCGSSAVSPVAHLHIPDASGESPENHERQGREPGDDREQEQGAGGNEQGLRTAEELSTDFPVELVSRGAPRDDHAGGRGDDQGGDLGDQAIPHREQRVGPQGIHERHALLRHPDHEPTDDVDDVDQQPGDCITANELAGAIHRPVELRLAGVLFGDDPGVHIGVDRHLFARHGVEGEARGHFGDAAGALDDHHELDDDQDQEDDEADDVVPLHHEGAERVDHITCKRLSQNEAGGGDVQ